MKVEHNFLKGKIVEKYGSQKEFAKAMGISFRLLSLKLNGSSDFSSEQMYAFGHMLNLSENEYYNAFILPIELKKLNE